MSDFSDGADSRCPVCKQQFAWNDGVPCDCLQEAEEEDRRIARMDARYDEMREGVVEDDSST